MQGFTLIWAFKHAVHKAVREHDHELTYVTPKINRSTGRRINRPMRHVNVRLKMVEAFMDSTGAFKKYDRQIYLNYGRYLR